MMPYHAIAFGLVWGLLGYHGAWAMHRAKKLMLVSVRSMLHEHDTVIAFRVIPTWFEALSSCFLAPVIGLLSLVSTPQWRRCLIGYIALAVFAWRFRMCEQHAQDVLDRMSDWVEGKWTRVRFSS